MSKTLSLSHVNGALVSALNQQGDRYTASKLNSCRHDGPHPSFCRQTNRCTVCSRNLRQQHQRDAHRQLSSSLTSNPGSVPVFLTVSTSDCHPEELRDRNKHILKSWHSLFNPDGRRQPLLARKTITAAGYVENIPSGNDSELVNPHLHSVLVMADSLNYTGRDYLKRFSDPDDPSSNDQQWMDFWQVASGSQARTAKVSVVRDLAAVTSYLYKTSFTVIDANGSVKQPAYVDPQSNQLLKADHILATQDATNNLTRVLKHRFN